MDKELSAETIRREKLRKLARGALAIVVVAVLFLGLKAILEPEVKRSRLLVSVAERGGIESTVTASGTVLPEVEHVLTSPIHSRVKAVYFEPGQAIRKGQPILELDSELTRIACDKLKDELALERNKETQLKLRLQQTMIDLDS